MKQVLFVGDINVDLIMGKLAGFPVADREITCESFEVTMGSSAVISACAYAALGGAAAFSGLAGTDEYGDFMVAGLRSAGVDTSRVRRTDAVKTGVTVNLLHDGKRTQITCPGTIAAFDGAGLDRESLRGVRHAHFAGPYLQTRFRPRITGILDLLRETGVSSSLDPQWDASEKWECLDEWLARLDFLFCNDDEARSITRAATPEEACARLAGGPAAPVVKRGKDGALFFFRNATVSLASFVVEAVDTTGAGDNFDSAFLFAVLEKGMTMPGACRFAVAAAARSCLFTGGVAARSSYADVIRFMEEQQ